MHLLSGHTDEVLDVAFDMTGRKLASASADGTSMAWNLGCSGPEHSYQFLSKMIGHENEISKAS